MSAKHTPGPWIVTVDCGAHVIRGAEEQHQDLGTSYLWRDYVASTWGGESEANARLIAAAPELLAALKTLHDKTAELIVHLQATDRLRPCFNLPALAVAQQVIAQAEGVAP